MTFDDRKNIIFIGEANVLFTTITGGKKLYYEAYIYLSVGYATDRTGQVYTEAITASGQDMFNHLKQDAKIAAVIK